MLSISENVSQEIKKIVERCSFDPWIGTPLEGYYKLSPSNMGEVGEILISDYMIPNTQAKKLFDLDWVYPIENWHDTNASCNKNLSEGLW